jgi:hypothetical protein
MSPCVMSLVSQASKTLNRCILLSVLSGHKTHPDKHSARKQAHLHILSINTRGINKITLPWEQMCSPIMEMGISSLQFEHLMVGKKLPGRA